MEPGRAPSGRLLRCGRNCWRREHAQRVAFLVDGAAYFDAFRSALERAHHSVLIVGWDIDSNLRLVRDGSDRRRERLADLLNRTAARRRGLHMHVLIWDFAMIYALEREWLPSYKLGWRSHRRIQFRLDGNHPVGASQHQKIVVVDDKIAFVGGMDLAKWRWDTPDHRPGDPRRTDPSGVRYPPFHDVQMLVDGAAAAALGELARQRWYRACGEHLAPAPAYDGDPWPPQVRPDLDRVPVGIARTEPAFAGRPEVREVERFYLDAIGAARRSIYVENQYLTSNRIGNALCRRLHQAEGPEVVLVLPLHTGGWLEQNTMDALRRCLLERLRRADRFGRLGVYYPVVPELDGSTITVHSKVLVVDGRLVTVGSANLSNRSMGLDSECNLILDAGDDPRLARGVAEFRDRLLGEHLGLSHFGVAEALAGSGSLLRLIASRSGFGRRLTPLDPGPPSDGDRLLADSALVDPERPVEPEQLAARFIPQEHHAAARRRLAGVIGALTVLFGLAAAWRWTPLSEWLDVDRVSAALAVYRDAPWAPLAVLAAFALGGVVMVPVTLLVVITALVFGPWFGFAYSLGGAVLSAVVNFGIGHALGRDTVRRLAGGRLDRLSRRMAKREILTVVTLRVVPVAPFGVVNLVAGVSHIRFRNYLIGTLMGMGPGTLGLTVFVDSIGSAIRKPEAGSIAVAAVVLAAVVLGALGLRRWLRRRRTAGS